MIDSVEAPKSVEILEENAHLSDMVGHDQGISRTNAQHVDQC